MRRAFRTSFTIAMATMMIGLAVAQARADRVGHIWPAILSSGGTDLSFGRSQFPSGAFATADLACSVTPAMKGSFSVNNSELNLGRTASYLAKPILAEVQPTIVAGSVVPEPTTMLLLGTGLVGAAAVLRKRLRRAKPLK